MGQNKLGPISFNMKLLSIGLFVACLGWILTPVTAHAQSEVEIEAEAAFVDSEAAIAEAEMAAERAEREKRLAKETQSRAKREIENARRQEVQAKKEIAQADKLELQAKRDREIAEKELQAALARQKEAQRQVEAAQLKLAEAQKARDLVIEQRNLTNQKVVTLKEEIKTVQSQIKETKARELQIMKDHEALKDVMKTVQLRHKAMINAQNRDEDLLRRNLRRVKDDLKSVYERIQRMEAELNRPASSKVVGSDR